MARLELSVKERDCTSLLLLIENGKWGTYVVLRVTGDAGAECAQGLKIFLEPKGGKSQRVAVDFLCRQ
jgi:hypothetical protein